MKTVPRRWLVAASVLPAMLLASCTVPTGPSPAPAPEPAPSKLSPANHVFDLEREGLKLLWAQELGQLTANRSLRDIYAAGDFVVVEADQGELHCIDARTGVWKAMAVLRNGLDRPPTAFGGRLYLVTESYLFSLDTNSGALSKPYNPGFPLAAAPLLYKDSLILAGTNGYLAVLRIADLWQQWLASLNAPVFDQPVVVEPRLYASGRGRSVLAWDLSPGINLELWRWTPLLPARISSGVAVYQDRLYVGDNRGFLYSLPTDGGEPTWKSMFEGPIVGRPLVVGSKLLFLTEKPSLVCIEAGGERQSLWHYSGAKEVLTVGKSAAYVLNEDHSVAAVALDTGKELWRDPLPADCKIAGSAGRPAFYIANPQGSVIAVQELD